MKIHYRIKNNAIEIVRCYGTDDRIVLPEEINGLPVVSAAPYAFSAHKDGEEDDRNLGERRCNFVRRRETSCRGGSAGDRFSRYTEGNRKIYFLWMQKTGTAGIFGYADAGGNRGVYGMQWAEGACDPSEKGNQILCEGDSWGIMAED